VAKLPGRFAVSQFAVCRLAAVIVVAGLGLSIVSSPVAAGLVDDAKHAGHEIKKVPKKIGQGAKQGGKAVGQAAKDGGHAVKEGAKEVGRKVTGN
jgi:hypothetical protein